MTNQEFSVLFKKYIESVESEKVLNIAVSVCKKLYFDYQKFTETHQWGDANLLMDAIKLCDSSKVGLIEENVLEDMLTKVDLITPDSDDFGDWIGSYALNACTSVYETLQFILDGDINHISNIAAYYTDTIDFKIQEEIESNGELKPEHNSELHPKMIEARKILLQEG